jgi:hypothetical protein
VKLILPAGIFKTSANLGASSMEYRKERLDQTGLLQKFQPLFSLVLLILLSINPKNWTFQAVFMVIAYFELHCG